MRLNYTEEALRNAERIKRDVFKGNIEDRLAKRICQLGYFTDSDKSSEWSNTFTGAFLTKYPLYTTVIKMIGEALGVSRPDWDMLTKQNLIRIVEYFKIKVCGKSARLYAKVLKSLLNDWDEEVDIPTSNFSKVLTVKDEPSTGIFLTEDEVNMIVDYKPESYQEEVVKAQWLCEYYLGGRQSDMLLIKDSNIDKREKVITYVSQKTKTEVRTPLHRNFIKYYKIALRRVFSPATYQKHIKEICRKAGIVEKVSVYLAGKRIEGEKWRFVGSHTARRSYACNLYLRGCDIYTISKRMGHRSVNITETYLVMNERSLPKEVNDWAKS